MSLVTSLDPATPECECRDGGHLSPVRCGPCVAALVLRHATRGDLGDPVRVAAARAILDVPGARYGDVDDEAGELAVPALDALLRALASVGDGEGVEALAGLRAAYAAQVRMEVVRPVLRVVRSG